MTTRNEQPRKSGSFLNGAAAPGRQSDWWKHKHPHVKPNGSTAFTTNVKTGFWKTYNVRNSGKK